MKNVTKYMLKNCIFISLDDFIDIIHKTLGDGVNVEYSEEGITSICTDEDCIYQEEINAALAKYFDVDRVTSCHIDGCEIPSVWICYEGANE